MLLTLVGLLNSSLFYGALTTSLPFTFARCEYLMGHLSQFVACGQSMLNSMIALAFELTWMMARASAVAFLCSACMTCLFIVAFFVIGGKGSEGIMRAQQKEARAVLRAFPDAAGAARHHAHADAQAVPGGAA